MKKYALSVLAVTLCSGPALANVETSVLIGTRGNKIAYVLSLPDDYDSTRKVYPCLVHLHGHGGQGSNPKGMGAPLGKMWKEKYELIGIFPQALKGQSWWHPQMLSAMADVIKNEAKRLRIDRTRIYLTGQSMGGYGSYLMATRYPNSFAAVAPISGAWGAYKKFTTPRGLGKLKKVPFWTFHGDRDRVAPFADNVKTVEAFRKSGIYTRFTVYKGGGHHVKGRVYNNPQFFEWLLAQKCGTPHNYELGVNDGKSTKVLGYFEPRSVQKITARAPDKAKKEVFTGWTSAAGTVIKDTTTNPSKSKGKFANARALTTTFTMPANDVIVTANYEINPNYKPPPPRTARPTSRPTRIDHPRPKRTDEDRARSRLTLAKSYIGAGLKAKAADVLKQLITKYPKTQAAKAAAAELEKLGKQP